MSTNSVGWYHLYPPCHLLILSPKSGNHITIPERVEGWETARSVLRGKVHPPLLLAFPFSPALHPGLPSLLQRGPLNPARGSGRALYALQTGSVATNTFSYILSTWHMSSDNDFGSFAAKKNVVIEANVTFTFSWRQVPPWPGTRG